MILEHLGQAGSRIRLDRRKPEQGGTGRIRARAIAVEHDDASLADGESLGAAAGIEDDGVAIRLPRELTRRSGRSGAADQGAPAELEAAVLDPASARIWVPGQSWQATMPSYTPLQSKEFWLLCMSTTPASGGGWGFSPEQAASRATTRNSPGIRSGIKVSGQQGADPLPCHLTLSTHRDGSHDASEPLRDRETEASRRSRAMVSAEHSVPGGQRPVTGPGCRARSARIPSSTDSTAPAGIRWLQSSTLLRSSYLLIPRGRSGNAVANHTWATRRRARARKVLIIVIVESWSCGFDSHHPLRFQPS